MAWRTALSSLERTKVKHLICPHRFRSPLTSGKLAVHGGTHKSRSCHQCEGPPSNQKHCQIFLGMILILKQAPLVPEMLQPVVFALGKPSGLPAGPSSHTTLSYSSSGRQHLTVGSEPSDWIIHIWQLMWKRACSKHPAQIAQESSSFLTLDSKQDSDIGESALGSCVWKKISWGTCS